MLRHLSILLTTPIITIRFIIHGIPWVVRWFLILALAVSVEDTEGTLGAKAISGVVVISVVEDDADPSLIQCQRECMPARPAPSLEQLRSWWNIVRDPDNAYPVLAILHRNVGKLEPGLTQGRMAAGSGWGDNFPIHVAISPAVQSHPIDTDLSSGIKSNRALCATACR